MNFFHRRRLRKMESDFLSMINEVASFTDDPHNWLLMTITGSTRKQTDWEEKEIPLLSPIGRILTERSPDSILILKMIRRGINFCNGASLIERRR